MGNQGSQTAETRHRGSPHGPHPQQLAPQEARRRKDFHYNLSGQSLWGCGGCEDSPAADALRIQIGHCRNSSRATPNRFVPGSARRGSGD
jgi:hypothetical protein